MALSSTTSFIVATISAIFIFSGMQMYKHYIISSHVMSLFGGYSGALFFTCLVTALGNLENIIFGKSYQMKLLPEVLICFATALALAGSIHRVCFTTCFLTSSIALYYINRLSQKVYASPVPATQAVGEKKKRK